MALPDWMTAGTAIGGALATVSGAAMAYFKYQLEALRSSQRECEAKHDQLREETITNGTKADLLESINRMDKRIIEIHDGMWAERASRRDAVERLEREIVFLRQQIDRT